MSPQFLFLLQILRRVRYRFRWKWRKFMKYWDRFKWCLIGGFGYAAARLLINWVQEIIP